MRNLILFTFCFLITYNCFSQSVNKKPLDHSVYDSWQSISAEKISRDGKFISYAVMPQAGDATLYIKNINDKSNFIYKRVNTAQFSYNSSYAIFQIKPAYEETRKAKIKKKKPDEMPKDSLAILNLNSKKLDKIARVKSYKLPMQASNVIAYLIEKNVTDSSKNKKTTEEKNIDAYYADETPTVPKIEATPLYIRNLNTGAEVTFKNISEYELDENGKFLLYTSVENKKDSTQAGVFLYDIEKAKNIKLSSGKGSYKNLVFDTKSTQLAFTAEKSATKALVKIPKLYYYNWLTDSATIIADEFSKGIPAKYCISENGKVFFSKSGDRLFFGTAAIPIAKDTNIVDFEVAKVDIWNYKDDYLQPMQLANLNRDLKRSYAALIYPKNKEAGIVQLADEKISEIDFNKDGDDDFAIGTSDFGKRVSIQWEGSSSKDAYLISLKDGSKKLINEAAKAFYTLSPKGNYVLWFDRKQQNWFSYDISNNKKIAFENRNAKFGEEDNDVPDDAGAYGFGAWENDDKSVLIYDRYDILRFNPKTGVAENLTNGYGRKNNITFRYRMMDDEQESVSEKEVLWLAAFSNVDKKRGWFKTTLSSNKNPEMVTLGNYSYSAPVKTKGSNIVIYEKGNYQQSPDLYVTTDFKKETKLSSINPQQSQFIWGTAELVKWITPRGLKSEGILYKPENFDPNKKYPMIVYFYEKLSDGLYNYQAPAPTPSRLNISYFVSNGYLVFTPDISYEIGYPGKSAEEFINSGVENLKKNAWVDGSKIGLQGQSWGGYQIAHLITRTNMYAAAWAGAPVVNMTSAYGGIRWQTGLNRQFQYEKTQSRIGGSLWEKPELFLENSPLFKLPAVQTPVVIMANDADGSVPWYQGIEMFTALRRLGKPVWLLNYNGEDHNLIQRQNRKDIQIREQQFFDHFLKGKAAPVWLEKGIPAVEKGRNWGFDLVEDKKVK